MMKDQKVRMSELKRATISHEEKCYCGIKKYLEPDEECTHSVAASLFLMSNDGGTFDDDESIFAIEIFRDAGARGGLKLVRMNHEVVEQKTTNLAQLMPGIGSIFEKHS